jgi:uncharacterized membrane protein
VISVWVLARWLHLLAAMTWIGGMLFILLALLPVIRPALPPDDRARLVGQVGSRFGVISLVALAVLLITGYLNGERRNVDWTDLTASVYGTRLLAKLALVTAIVVVTSLHVWYGRRIVRLASVPAGAEVAAERRRLQVISGMLSALNLVLNLVVVWIAASLIA